MALSQMHDTWTQQVEDRKIVGVLIRSDQSAAFDLCDHFILLELSEEASLWFTSYLSGRKQSCSIDGKISHFLDIPPCGVTMQWTETVKTLADLWLGT